MKQAKLIGTILLWLITILTIFGSCKSTSQTGQKTVVPEDSSINLAITEIATFFINTLVPNTKIGIIGIENTADIVSDYIAVELSNHLSKSSLVVLERNRLDLLRSELNFQMSGEVSDDSFQSIGQFYGAETLIYGKIDRITPTEYRLVMYATNVQRASSITFIRALALGV